MEVAMKTVLVIACSCAVACLTVGCVSVRAPENIDIGSGQRSRPADVDSSRVPPTGSHEEARAELTKAYQQIQYLEDQLARCERKLHDARKKADKYERKYDDLKDKYDD
jgi:hypothetical protein